MPRSQRAALTLTLAAAAALSTACGSDATLIQNRVQMEVDACKAASTPSFEVKFGANSSYAIDTALCKEHTLQPAVLDDEITAHVNLGPYQFNLRKNLSEGRWFIHQVKWAELDEARSILTWDNISDSDYKRAIDLFTKAETQAPALEEPRLSKLDILLLHRKKANKDNDPEPAGLGPELQAYFAQCLKAAADHKNPDLDARVRTRVIQWYDDYRQTAEEFSIPSESAAEYERGAIKAIQNEADEAKKAKNDALFQEKMAEIEQREKEMVLNAAQRIKDAERMRVLADALKARQCAEIQAAATSNPTSADLKTELNAARTLITCP